MRWVVKRITRRHRLGVSHEETTLERDQITLGRGADADVHLPHLTVALAHARLTAAGERIAITALSRAGITVDNASVRHAEVGVGGSFGIGRYGVRVLDGTAPGEIHLEIELAPDTSTSRAGGDLGLVDRRPSKRRIAYVAAGAIAALFVLVPLLGALDPSVRSALRQFGIPSDLAWNSGPLANVHRQSRDRCEDCHRNLFERVTDEACTSCHNATREHGAGATAPGKMQPRCADCHREHNGDTGFSDYGPRLCTACHDQPITAGDGRTLAVVKRFSDAHPDFAVTLAGENGVAERIALTSRPREHSGLLFDHAGHLRAGGISGPDGKVTLDCGDCHEPEAEGRRFQPVSMTRHCEACHQLAFDTAESARVPHADVPVVMKTLREYYARRALEGGYSGYAPPAPPGNSMSAPARDAPPPAVPDAVLSRRRPGDQLDAPERLAALAWADATAAFVGKEMVRYRVCATCHVVQGGSADMPLRIEPVRIVGDWMPAAVFHHARHKTTACGECHAAGESDDSADVLMPEIGTCRACHGDSGSRRHEVATACVDCHRYHSPTHRASAGINH